MDFLCHLIEARFQFVDVDALACRDEDAVVVHLCHPTLFEFLQRDIFAKTRCEVVVVLLYISEGIHFVEHQYHRFILRLANVLKCTVDHLYLLLKLRMGDVYHMHENIGIAHLVEGRLERVDKMRGEFADKADGVGEQEREVVDNHLAHCSVERGEKFVFGKHIRLAQQVHQRGLAHIGIAHKGDAREFASVFALYGFLLVDALQFLFQPRNLVEDDTSVGLNLGLTRTAHTDTASLAFEVSPHSGESRQQVLVLRKFHLSACGCRLRSLGEDVENQVCAVENLHFQFVLDVEHLL